MRKRDSDDAECRNFELNDERVRVTLQPVQREERESRMKCDVTMGWHRTIRLCRAWERPAALDSTGERSVLRHHFNAATPGERPVPFPLFSLSSHPVQRSISSCFDAAAATSSRTLSNEPTPDGARTVDLLRSRGATTRSRNFAIQRVTADARARRLSGKAFPNVTLSFHRIYVSRGIFFSTHPRAFVPRHFVAKFLARAPEKKF